MNVNELRGMIKPVDKTKPYVFVSYRKLDAEIVYPMIIELQKKGVNLWIDTTGLEGTGGKVWSSEAFGALRSSKCKKLLFFMSVNSFMSVPVLSELQFTKNKKFILQHPQVLKKDEFFILPINIDSNMKGMGGVIKACEQHEAYSNCIDDDENNYYGSKIFKASLNPENIDDIDESFEYSGLIQYVFMSVFNEQYERTVVSDISSILSNVPKEAIYNDFEVTESIKVTNVNETILQKETKLDFDVNNTNNTTQANDATKIDSKETVKDTKYNIINDKYFETHKNDKDLIENEQKALKFYDEFKSKFSPEKLKELSGLTLLRSLFLNDEGNQTNICSLFEYNKDYIQFGSIKGGTALKHVLYYSAKEKSWMTGKPPITFNKLTEQEAIELGTKIRDNIVKACEIIDRYKDKLNTEEAYSQIYNEIDTQADGIHKVLFVKKYFHMMYRDLFPCMFSTGFIRRVADIFGYEKNLDDTKYIAKFEMTKNKHGISNYLFSLIVYKFFDETIGNSGS